MKALVYHGPGRRALEEVPKPTIQAPTDVIVKLTTTTICGSDLHILKGDVPAVTDGRILGHEGVGVVDEVGDAVIGFKVGDRVIISCISSCGKCENCKKSMYSHCLNGGGWILGHLIDGTHAEYVRIPFGDNSLYPVPDSADEEALVMISDILPTGFEIGVLNGHVQPGDTIAIVGAGPVGLSALITAQLYSPAKLIMIDLDDARLEVAKQLGATHTVNSSSPDAVDQVMAIGDGIGVKCGSGGRGHSAYPRVVPGDRGPRWTHRQRRRARQAGAARYGEAVDPQHHADDRARGHAHDSDAAQDGGVGQTEAPAADHAPLQPGPGRGRLRHIRQRGQGEGPEGDHHSLIGRSF